MAGQDHCEMGKRGTQRLDTSVLNIALQKNRLPANARADRAAGQALASHDEQLKDVARWSLVCQQRACAVVMAYAALVNDVFTAAMKKPKGEAEGPREAKVCGCPVVGGGEG